MKTRSYKSGLPGGDLTGGPGSVGGTGGWCADVEGCGGDDDVALAEWTGVDAGAAEVAIPTPGGKF